MQNVLLDPIREHASNHLLEPGSLSRAPEPASVILPLLNDTCGFNKVNGKVDGDEMMEVVGVMMEGFVGLMMEIVFCKEVGEKV